MLGWILECQKETCLAFAKQIATFAGCGASCHIPMVLQLEKHMP